MKRKNKRKIRFRRPKVLLGVVSKIVTEEMYEQILKPCIEALVKYHPNDKIVIVDSDSEWRYFDEVKKIKSNIIIEDIKNKDYVAGAWFHLLEKYPNEDMYVLLQDSSRIVRNLEEAYPKKGGVCVFGPRWYKCGSHSAQKVVLDLAKKILKKLGKPPRGRQLPEKYPMTACNSFIVGKRAAEKIAKLNEWKTVLPSAFPPANAVGKWNCQVWERLWGIVFQEASAKVSYLNQLRPRRRGGRTNWLARKKCWRDIKGADMADGQGRA